MKKCRAKKSQIKRKTSTKYEANGFATFRFKNVLFFSQHVNFWLFWFPSFSCDEARQAKVPPPDRKHVTSPPPPPPPPTPICFSFLSDKKRHSHYGDARLFVSLLKHWVAHRRRKPWRLSVIAELGHLIPSVSTNGHKTTSCSNNILHYCHCLFTSCLHNLVVLATF